MPPFVSVVNPTRENKWFEFFDKNNKLKKQYRRHYRLQLVQRLYKKLPKLAQHGDDLLELDEIELEAIDGVSLDSLTRTVENTACMAGAMVTAYCGITTDLAIKWVGVLAALKALPIGIMLGVTGIISLGIAYCVWKNAMDEEREKKTELAKAYIDHHHALNEWKKAWQMHADILANTPNLPAANAALDSILSWQPSLDSTANVTLPPYVPRISILAEQDWLYRLRHHPIGGPAITFMNVTFALAGIYWGLYGVSALGISAFLMGLPFGVGFIPIVFALGIAVFASYRSYRVMQESQACDATITALNIRTDKLHHQIKSLHHCAALQALTCNLQHQQTRELARLNAEKNALQAEKLALEQRVQTTSAQVLTLQHRQAQLVLQLERAQKESKHQQTAIGVMRSVCHQLQTSNNTLKQEKQALLYEFNLQKKETARLQRSLSVQNMSGIGNMPLYHLRANTKHDSLTNLPLPLLSGSQISYR